MISFPRLRRVIPPVDSFFSKQQSTIDSTIVAEEQSVEMMTTTTVPEHYDDNSGGDDIIIDELVVQEEGFDCELCGQYLRNNFEYEHHLETLHHHVCTECSRVFPSGFLLSVHLEENHDSYFSVMANKTNCYQCLVEDKSICNAKFRTSKERDEHMRQHHLYKNDFCFENVGEGIEE